MTRSKRAKSQRRSKRSQTKRSRRILDGAVIRGVKGFSLAEGADIPLRPLTLVFGPNNGGKSTILKTIANLGQT